MSVPKFIHGVAKLFEGDEARERRELERIENERQARLARQAIVSRAAALRDAVGEARRRFELLCAPIEGACKLDQVEIYKLWLGHDATDASTISIAREGHLLAGHDAVKKHADDLKKFLRTQTVAIAEKALADYERANAEVLKDVKLVPADEADFVPLKLSPTHYTDGTAAKLAAAAIAPG